jgi:hypothetical protein
LTRRSKLIVLGIGAVYAAALIYLDVLRFPVRADELHFWPTTLALFERGFPSLEQLRSYNELSTPLPFLIFGSLEAAFHGGIAVGRALNLAVSLALLALIAAAGRFLVAALLCAVGLLAFPYFLPVSTHLYTDIIATALATAGVALHQSGRYAFGAVAFVLAIASRQLAVAFPLAIVAHEALRQWNARQFRFDWAWAAPLLAALTYGGWVLFFGGLAPATALQQQSLDMGRWYPNHALYFLTTIGLYFVVVEAVLFRSLAALRRPMWPSIALALIVAALFVAFPPLQNVNTITDTMGYLDRTTRMVLGDGARMALYALLAALACLRFPPLSLPGLVLYANAGLMLKAHVAWDKYALPVLAVLWLLRAAQEATQEPRSAHAIQRRSPPA